MNGNESGRSTWVAPSNIAFIKYWGTRDTERTLPFNPSVSMTLGKCVSRTTVVAVADAASDEVLVRDEEGDLEPAAEHFARGVLAHLDRLREWSGTETRFRVATENSFPTAAGIASSASGFAALTLATLGALGREASPRELSVLARLSGSGSAARSVMGGYVEWPAGEAEGLGHATQLAVAEHWDLRDLVAILASEAKMVSSKEGHGRALTSPYFEVRQGLLAERLEKVRQAIRERDFAALAPVVEEEAIDLHLIAMSSRPPIFYWRPGTLEVQQRVRELRAEGAEVCFTMDAGANVHVICTPDSEPHVAAALEAIPEVQRLIRDGVGSGPAAVGEHLI